MGVLVGVLIISGISYALWSTTKEQTSINKISSGCLKLEVTEGTNINIENAYQTPDNEGLKQNGYTFTINNNCNHEEYVEVNLDINKNNTLNEKNIRATLLYNNQKIIEPNNLNNLLDRETNNKEYNTGKHLTTVKISSNSNKQLNLKIWLDENTSFNDLQENNTFESKIEIDSIKRENILASDYVRIISEDNEQLAYDETIDNNLRYIGATPNNYIDIGNGEYSSDIWTGYDNEDVYKGNYTVEYTSGEKCKGNNNYNKNCTLVHKKDDPILWRIIGVMNNVDDGTGKIESRLKIIRDEGIGRIAWDAKAINNQEVECIEKNQQNCTYKNNWEETSIKETLNNAFWNKITTSAKNYIYEYDYTNNKFMNKWKQLDFSKEGMNEKSKKLFENAKWHLGGITSTEYNTATAAIYYLKEHANNVYSTNPTSTNAMVGLMYASDYGYATGGGEGKQRSECLAKDLYHWDVSGYENCYKNNWLYDPSNHQWLMNPYASSDFSVARVSYDGSVYPYANVFNNYRRVRPVLYLKSDVKIVSGDGSKVNPFKLAL